MTRAALYARVSTEEQVEGYSLDAQSRAFHSLVESRGWSIYKEYVEEGKSAHSNDVRKRPIFQQAFQDAFAGQYDVLVVHKIDRFSRKLRVTLEYLEKLAKAGVGFVSIQQQMDYSRPEGKLMLAMLGAMAEFYSDNLGEETKKGMRERTAQGLYCGHLPFGYVKGEDGVPIADPLTYQGVVQAFKLSAEGKSDREIAETLNDRGYRTACTSGRRPFSSASVRGILTNRFYVGYLMDGQGGWLQGKHGPLVDQELWDSVQEARRRNSTFTHSSRPKTKRVWSLTGLAYCWRCKGRIHSQYIHLGEPRLGCYNRNGGLGCEQKSAQLSVYERQIVGYLDTFHIPRDYQQRLMEAHCRLDAAYSDTEEQRAKLERQLKRARELYELGDYTRAEYLARRDAINRQIEVLAPARRADQHLDRLAQFLADVPMAWEAATQEQRNKLARALFDQVWLEDKTVVAVKPRLELEPFFKLNYEDFLKGKDVEPDTSGNREADNTGQSELEHPP